jgi:phosphoglycolate phosphatase-like HAD superfamily hydrolase
MDPVEALKALKPTKAFFVGIDSDGCIFDTMETKHKECFTPCFIKWFKLQAVSKYAREAWDFVNLYSKMRGMNRWPALVHVLDLLAARPEVQARGVKFPFTEAVRAFAQNGKHPMSNAGLAAYMAEHPGDPALEVMLKWSTAVNDMIADMVEGVPPFPGVRESLAKLQPSADLVIVSQTPLDALAREWAEHDIDHFARAIAGQEMGSKAEHIKFAAEGKYAKEKMLMIGDAPGDRKAAKANGAMFYPINPGHEEDSWKRFHEEAIDKFLAGTFAGDYEKMLNDEFESYLPATPAW